METDARNTMEWLEADGLGGFASGTVGGPRTRRYHALLLVAATPPTGRFVLVSGLEAWVETPAGRFAISSQRYAPDVVHPDGARRLRSFRADPFPTWTYRLEDGTTLEAELFVPRGQPEVILRWRLAALRDAKGANVAAGAGRVTLLVRPLLSGRDYHGLHRENPDFHFDAEVVDGGLVWQPYTDVPAVRALTNGDYRHAPLWYRNFQYDEERERGLDFIEDLASPGEIVFDLTAGDATLVLTALAGRSGGESASPGTDAHEYAVRRRETESRRRRAFPSRLHRSAEEYIVTRGAGATIVAGYPWFTDWGRDTFIALRGLCLATGRLKDAREILMAWADAVSEGMLPNRFPDRGESPEYNSVDASLWYAVAVNDYLTAIGERDGGGARDDRRRLEAAVDAILAGYAAGTRYGIRADGDGLLLAGAPGVQLTWMDAKVGDWVVTPRRGKPVEVEALWLNALWVGSRFSKRWKELLERGRAAFQERYWDAERGCLHDVVDCDGRTGTIDASFRPNQIFAVGGLPLVLLPAGKARRVVDAVESLLWTPRGLRSLAPGEPGYAGRYRGGVLERDGAYHQGTVWPWLAGAFVEAWMRVRGGGDEVKRDARARFLMPLRAALDEAGLGHVSEIADGDPPHAPRGCPFQAWSLGELLRLEQVVLAEENGAHTEPASSRGARTGTRRGRRVTRA